MNGAGVPTLIVERNRWLEVRIRPRTGPRGV